MLNELVHTGSVGCSGATQHAAVGHFGHPLRCDVQQLSKCAAFLGRLCLLFGSSGLSRLGSRLGCSVGLGIGCLVGLCLVGRSSFGGSLFGRLFNSSARSGSQQVVEVLADFVQFVSCVEFKISSTLQQLLHTLGFLDTRKFEQDAAGALQLLNVGSNHTEAVNTGAQHLI